MYFTTTLLITESKISVNKNTLILFIRQSTITAGSMLQIHSNTDTWHHDSRTVSFRYSQVIRDAFHDIAQQGHFQTIQCIHTQ